MSQQSGIIVMIDVAAAIEANTLEGNVYMFDNMKLQGSTGHGTGKFTSMINGSHWFDGSMANEQVLNWGTASLGSIPPTVPKSFQQEKSKNSDLKALQDFQTLVNRIETTEKDNFTNVASVLKELKQISANTGVKTKIKSKRKNAIRDLGTSGQKMIDVTGELVTPSEGKMPNISPINPVITNITGEAVDKNVMYVAQYGSPELVTDGWYWCASVDASKVGTYAYTMHIQLHQPSFVDGEWTLVPIDMTHEAYIKVTTNPKVNGFTGAGIGMLPIPTM